MKWIAQLNLFFLLFSINLFAQDNFWSQTSLDSIGVIAFSQTNDNVLYAGGNKKLYKSINGGLSWINLFNNWSNTYIDNIVACNDTVVLLGTSNYGTSNYVGIIRSSDQGITWTTEALKDTSVWTLFETENKIVFAGTGNGDIYRSTDTGLHWNLVYPNSTGNGIHSFASDNSLKMIAGFNQGAIANSTDSGINWTFHSPSWNVYYIYDLLFVDNAILAATSEGLYKSEDLGLTWNQLSPNIIKSVVKLLFIAPSQIYAMDGNWLNEKFYISNDKGGTWESLNSGLPDNSYFYDMAKHGNYIFVGTDFGVYKSKEITQAANTTVTANATAGSQSIEVLSIEGFSIGDDIIINPGGANEESNVITGFGSLILQSPLQFNHLAGEQIINTTATSIEEKYLNTLNEYSISHNYPNPFNPSTKFSYSITQSGLVTLKIYDVLGTEIETLVNEEKSLGTYELNWNAAKLPSGVYFYRLQAGSFVQTRKMILMK